jgi:GH15 family glucan-1,4-alpha-glucosidase
LLSILQNQMVELSPADIQLTAKSIEAVQSPGGAIAWVPGGQCDVWNHVEAAMALNVAGRRNAADRAFLWLLGEQRADGSFPMKYVDGVLVDGSGDANATAYVAVGMWHHWRSWGDLPFLQHLWPTVRRGLDWVCSRQLAWGGIAWTQPVTHLPTQLSTPATQLWDPGLESAEALLAGSSSIFASLRAGIAIAEQLQQEQPTWLIAAQRLRHAIQAHESLFLNKSEFSMDWYYPVLTKALEAEVAAQRLTAQWEHFVRPKLGVRCVATDPWVTGAETCELALALWGIGRTEEAAQLFSDMQHLRTGEGSYWTGLVYPELVNWPDEKTTYTSAAVILAWDALFGRGPAADILPGFDLPQVQAQL